MKPSSAVVETSSVGVCGRPEEFLMGNPTKVAAISAGPKETTMTITSKWEAAKILRGEAENIRRHGLTNVFNLSFIRGNRRGTGDRCASRGVRVRTIKTLLV